MLYGTKVAVCSQINTKHAHTMWQNVSRHDKVNSYLV